MLLDEKQKVKSFACLQVSSTDLVFVVRNGHEPQCCHFIERAECGSRKQWVKAIKAFQESTGFDHEMEVIGLLSTGDYQLITIDRPDVDDSEMRGAIPWAVSSQLSRPLDKVVFEYFSLPYVSAQTSKPQIMVVAANKEWVVDFKKAIEACRMNLVSITIPEMTSTWLMKHLHPDVESYVLIRWLVNAAEMMIIHEDELVMTAILPKPPLHIDSDFINTFSLSISQLFFRFQKILPEVETGALPIWFGFIEGHNEELVDFFHEHFTNEIHVLDLTTVDFASESVGAQQLVDYDIALFGGLVRDD